MSAETVFRVLYSVSDVKEITVNAIDAEEAESKVLQMSGVNCVISVDWVNGEDAE